MNAPQARRSEPVKMADLHLPPTFVADHCLRALYYRGPMSPMDLARHWRVHVDIAAEVVESLKTALLIEPDSGHGAFERLGRMKLTAAGQAQVAAARTRTWYAGPLPVAMEDVERGMRSQQRALTGQQALREALAPFFLEDARAEELGQAVAGGATIALSGVAFDEQEQISDAIGSALTAGVTLPFAMFASGAVIRVVDAKTHQRTAVASEDDTIDLLRSHEDTSQWLTVAGPAVKLAGGVLASDMVPAYDEDARFYLAPAPFLACGGLLAVFDSASNPEALSELARLWLVPGRHGTGIMLLRSGERIEVPWHASTLLLGASPDALPSSAQTASLYGIDISRLSGAGLRSFLGQRLPEPEVFPDASVDALARLLERDGMATRDAAAQAARYMRDRAAYEGEGYVATADAVEQAARFAGCGEASRPTEMRRAA